VGHGTPPNNGMQRTAPRTAADAERWQEPKMKTIPIIPRAGLFPEVGCPALQS
jgi:hypothetical protein